MIIQKGDYVLVDIDGIQNENARNNTTRFAKVLDSTGSKFHPIILRCKFSNNNEFWIAESIVVRKLTEEEIRWLCF